VAQPNTQFHTFLQEAAIMTDSLGSLHTTFETLDPFHICNNEPGTRSTFCRSSEVARKR
jgi:hypothetical protein